MARKHPRSISVTEQVYARMKRHCEANGISLAQLIEALTADIGATK